MFKGLGMEPFTFGFSNGVVTGPSYSFDLKLIIATLNDAEKAFYRASPSMLIHFVYENWNKQFNPSCIVSGGNLNLGVTWNQQCLIQSGTPNLLTAAGQGILGALSAWGVTYLGTAPTPTNGGTQPPVVTQCATSGKSPVAGQSCCPGLVKDPFNVCNAPANIPGGEACVGTWICSVPDMWLYGGLAVLAFLAMKR